MSVERNRDDSGVYQNQSEQEKLTSLKERFFSKIDTSDECHLWLGLPDDDGYGYIHGNHRKWRAHRLAWELHSGEKVPESMFICHTCDTPMCVNPQHLFVGSYQDNVDDMVSKGRHNRGEQMPASKLKEPDIKMIRILLADGATLKAIAEKYGVSIHLIWLLRHEKIWKHVK